MKCYCVYLFVSEVLSGVNVTVYCDVSEVQDEGNITVFSGVCLRYRLGK